MWAWKIMERLIRGIIDFVCDTLNLESFEWGEKKVVWGVRCCWWWQEPGRNQERHEECTMITTQNEWLIHSLEVRIIIQKIEPVLASERQTFTILIWRLCCVCRNTLRVQCRVRVGTYGIPTARIIHIPPLAYNSCVCLHNMILVFVRCIQFQ